MEFCEKVVAFFSKTDAPVLFAGAGLSAAAGLPTWSTYLEYLAQQLQPHDPMSCHHMRELIRENDLLGAASQYFFSKKLPLPEKYKQLAVPFDNYNTSPIKSIGGLPFSSYVTTNYDRVLFDVYASSKGKSAREVNLNDPTLSSAIFDDGFYIARIHGRVEVPSSMVLSDQHYETLLRNESYVDFLMNCFTRKSLVFIGFSFLDPAIKHILEIVEKKYGRVHLGRHIAILHENADAELVTRLEQFGIEKAFYDDKHDVIWKCLDECVENINKQKGDGVGHVAKYNPLSAAKRYIAACYARTKLQHNIVPLRDSVIEGIISHLLQTHESGCVPIGDVVKFVSDELKISDGVARPLVRKSISSLVADSLCEQVVVDNDLKVKWSGDKGNHFSKAIEQLVHSTINRFVVREGGIDSDVNRRCLAEFYEQLIVSRGWDLGAAFASHRAPEDVDVHEVMSKVKAFSETNNEVNIGGLSRTVEDVLKNPSADESKVLSELGRMSFALEMVLNKPNSTLVHELTLPEIIYLDANVLMPAITPGHPYHDIYKNVIDRLKVAVSAIQKKIEIVTYKGFLNEVVSHRRLAIQEMEYITTDEKDILRKEASYYGVINMNVYVGAYANLLAQNNGLSFDLFLKQYAPYANEYALQQWLIKSGVTVFDDNRMKKQGFKSADIYHVLEKEYSDNIAKTGTLIGHDAVQIGALRNDIDHGIRSIFVSADKRLRDVVSESDFSYVGESMISHVGLAQLIDLLVGVQTEPRGAESMYWLTKTSTSTEKTKNYLIDMALREYDEAYAMTMHKVVEQMAQEIENEAERRNIQMSPNTPDEREIFRKFINSFEEKYFKEMRKVIEKEKSKIN